MKKPFIKGITITIFIGLLTVIVLQQGNFFDEEPEAVVQPKEIIRSVEDLKPQINSFWDDHKFPEPPKSFASRDSTFIHVMKPKELPQMHMSSSKSVIFQSDFIEWIVPALDPRQLTKGH